MRYRLILVLALIACVYSCKKDDAEPKLLSMKVYRMPDKSDYKVGETLNLSGICVMMYYEKHRIETVFFEDLSSNGLVCTPANGTTMSLSTNTLKIVHTKSNQSVEVDLFVYEPTVTDYDGNVYGVVKVGSQLWMASNLKVTHYPNGSPIPMVSDNNSSGSSNDEWAALAPNAKAICFLNEDSESQYGALYTWSAAIGDATTGSSTKPSNLQGVCPDGWHLPSNPEWWELKDYIDNVLYTQYGNSLKSTSGWYNNGNGSDIYGFSALPAGIRDRASGNFLNQTTMARWWSATGGGTISYTNEIGAFNFYLTSSSNVFEAGGAMDGNSASNGFSVRCVKD